jgi:preprotein translocase subunit YajC
LSFSATMFQPAAPKAGTPGVSVPPPDSSSSSGSPPPSTGSMWVMMAPLFIVMIVMLFMNRGQRKREAEVRAKLKKGDRVVSQSGLVGELVDMDDRLARVKIAPGTNVQMLVSSIGPFEAAPAKEDKQLKDLKDAKAAADKK